MNDPFAKHQFTVLLCSLIVTVWVMLISFAQAFTRLRAGGQVSGRDSSPEDKKNLVPLLNKMLGGNEDDQVRKQREKTATRWQNLASNAYEMPPFCLVLLWGALISCGKEDHAKAIANCSIAFTILRVLHTLLYAAGINGKFVPVRSLSHVGSLFAVFVAAAYGLAGAADRM